MLASGMWARCAEVLVPAMLFNPELVETLGKEFQTHHDFRSDLANMATKELAASHSASGEIGAWFVSRSLG